MAKKNRVKAACANCRKALKKSWTSCPRCGRPVMGSDRATKAAGSPAFIAQSARPQCRRCAKASPAGSRFCVHCGTAFLDVVKSGGLMTFRAGRDAAMQQLQRDKYHPDPNIRAAAQDAINRLKFGPHQGAS